MTIGGMGEVMTRSVALLKTMEKTSFSEYDELETMRQRAYVTIYNALKILLRAGKAEEEKP